MPVKSICITMINYLTVLTNWAKKALIFYVPDNARNSIFKYLFINV